MSASPRAAHDGAERRPEREERGAARCIAKPDPDACTIVER